MSTNATTAVPKWRKKLAQGKERSDAALGWDSLNTSSPEGAKEWPHSWRLDLPAQFNHCRGMLGETENRLSINHAASGTLGVSKSKFVSLLSV